LKIVVASGKGGTGKSMLASSLSILFSEERKIVACDCDVDAPNLGLWLGVTEYKNRESISTSERARIDPDKCVGCGLCYENCNFGAVTKRDKIYEINSLLCEGCGVCKLVCPEDAIEIFPVNNGEIMMTITEWGFPLVSGQLKPGETGSGKIVQELRRKADTIEHEVMILDAAAGIGCPVISSITGCDFAVLVTEPTPSGFSDLQRVLEIVNHFEVPYGIVVNKWDINPDVSKKIIDWSGETFLGKISYDRKVVESIVNLRPAILSDSKVKDEIKKVFEQVKTRTETLK